MKSVEQEPLLYFYKGDHSPLADSRSWLAWLLNLTQQQQPESEREASIAEMGLHEFAHSLRPHLQVDWDAEPFGAPPAKPLKIMKRRKAVPPVKNEVCVLCGQPGVYHSPPSRWSHGGQRGWYCTHHEAEARERDAEDAISASILPGLQAATPENTAEGRTERPQRTDLNLLLREVLAGLDSFLTNNEWTFPAVTLTPTVSLGSGRQPKPARQAMGRLRDVVLAGISDLLMIHGHKIRRCKARNCNRAFLAIRRQTFCSNRCASNTRSDRFQRKLGKEEFRERRHEYYEKAQQLMTGNPNVRVGRRRRKGA